MPIPRFTRIPRYNPHSLAVLGLSGRLWSSALGNEHVQSPEGLLQVVLAASLVVFSSVIRPGNCPKFIGSRSAFKLCRSLPCSTVFTKSAPPRFRPAFLYAWAFGPEALRCLGYEAPSCSMYRPLSSVGKLCHNQTNHERELPRATFRQQVRQDILS
jgi:hypothetical protein